MKIPLLRNLKTRTIFLLYASVLFVAGALLGSLFILTQLRQIADTGQSIQSLVWSTVVVILIGLAITLLIGRMLFSRLIASPLEQVKEETKRWIELENYSGSSLSLPVGEEMQSLVIAFNQMTGRVKEFKDGIEGKITERTRLLEEGSRLVQEVLDTTPNLLCLMNTEIDQYNYVNHEFADFFGVDNEEMIRLGPTFMRGRVFPNDQGIYKKQEQRIQAAQDDEVIQTDYRIANFKGEWRWLSIRSIIFQRNRENKPKLVLHVGQDITTLKETEEKLRFLSIHDQLSGLYNRLYFEEELSRLERGRVFPISVIMADLDNLKLINDTFGHAEGDEAIRAAAQILRSSFRSEDVVARIGGDEFAALLPGATEAAVTHIIERINEKILANPLFNRRDQTGISLGATTIQKGGSLADAIKEADAQMYLIKQSRKATKLN
jgi:diguanylate cyclase (GGDEF)-like protein/PAS domain S-box-containing protein